jgi:CRP-like cAMP-binding protein
MELIFGCMVNFAHFAKIVFFGRVGTGQVWYRMRKTFGGQMAKNKPSVKQLFEVGQYLATSGVHKKLVTFRKGETVYSQGEKCDCVFYLQTGTVKVSVTSSTGKEAVVAILRPGDFFGEGCIAGQPLRVSTATATEPTTTLEIEKREMIRVIHEERGFSDRFVAHMLKRNVRIEEDLVDQLFNSSEKRLARALLLVARYGNNERPQKIVAQISQETLAEIVGTTRSRVSYFMNKFRRLGFIQYNGGIHVHDSLLRVILHD